MMNYYDSKLVNAKAEFEFWRGFIRCWQLKHGPQVEPRILEALKGAEIRYQKVLEEGRDT